MQSEEEIFHAALELAPGERPAYLAQACGADEALRRRVDALLEAGAEANPFFGRGPMGVVLGQQAPLPGAAKPPSEKPGDRIGRYKLLEKIGEGGMGVVYMAEQQEDVRRRVALKVIKLGMDTAQVVARFEAERQALALMDHPNIAKVLDAGATDTGRPFFVMELVQGVPITEFCKKNHLSVAQRLKLLVPICQAIQGAHQKGIIHRDLKPGNVLVTLTAGLPHPMVIDFGVAKATNQNLTEKTFFTNFGAMIGTPAYMSPEQAEMSRLDVDTRSDIYSLGALFYELLTGTTPFPEERLRSAGYDEMRRIIMEEEPERPSTRLRRKSRAAGSASQPSTLSSQLSTDLDWVVMKCLEKDPERRYATADALASDVQRYLENEPVVARPPSAAYRLKKLVQRNKLVFAAAAAVAAALVAGLGASSWLYLREKAARRQAVAAEKVAATEAAKSGQVARFLADMLKSVGPSVAVGRDTTMLREILDRTAARAGKELQSLPEVRADIQTIIGNVYSELGLFDKAEAMHRAVLATVIKLHGPQHSDVATALFNLGGALQGQSKLIEAEEVDRQALAMRRKLLGNEHPDVAISLENLAEVFGLQGKLAEAEAMLREVVAIQKKSLGGEHTDAADSIQNLAQTLRVEGKFAQAEAMEREALAMRRKLLGEHHPDVATSLNGLAVALVEQGKLKEAEALHRQALALRKEMLPNDHPAVAESLNNLAIVCQDMGKFAEAEAAHREALAIERKLLGGRHPQVANSLNNLALVLSDEGRLADAEAMEREALALWQAHFGPEHFQVAAALNNLAVILQDEHNLAEAEPMQRDALAMRRRTLGHTHPAVAASLEHLAELLSKTGRLEEAGPLLQECLKIREKTIPDDWRMFWARSAAGENLLALKRYADAEPLLIAGCEGLQQRRARIPAGKRAYLNTAFESLIRFYEETGQPDKAAQWKTRSRVPPAAIIPERRELEAPIK